MELSQRYKDSEPAKLPVAYKRILDKHLAQGKAENDHAARRKVLVKQVYREIQQVRHHSMASGRDMCTE